MKRIGIISDTHGHLHPRVREFLQITEEIWHAGDIGSAALADDLEKFKPLRAVYGNIDDHNLRLRYKEFSVFQEEGFTILLQHIGGYPGRYTSEMKERIGLYHPGIVVCGHSHILKIQFDKQNNHLHINPGAAGIYGIHRFITAVRLVLDHSNISDVEVMEIPRTKNSIQEKKQDDLF